MIGRLTKRILHRLIRGLVVHPIRLAVVFVALIAAVTLLVTQEGLPSVALTLPTLGLPNAVGSGLTRNPPASTEDYMKGTETFNAELVWNALSDDAQGRYRSRGGSMEALQSQMDQARQAGAQLDHVTYIGGQSFPDGTSMHFYTVLTRGPQSRGDAEPIPYVFTLDQSGKIVRVQ